MCIVCSGSEEVAVEINAKSDDHPANSPPDSPASMGSSGVMNDIIDVPDRMVGLSMCHVCTSRLKCSFLLLVSYAITFGI